MKARKLVTLLLSVFVLSGCSNFKGFAVPVGTPGTAVNPASINYFAHVGDTQVYSHEDATPGRPISEPEKPEQTGPELFVGWSQKEKYETPEDIWEFSNPIPVETKAMTFYGQWELPIKNVTIEFYKTAADFEEFISYATITVKEGSEIPADQMPANPTIEGKTFLGWYTAGDSSMTVVDFTTYKASMSQNMFIAKWDGEGPTPVVHVDSVSLDITSKELNVGQTVQLTATVLPADAKDKTVSWSSSNNGVATVSDAGLVTAKAAGNATITVTTNDGGKTATCAIVVSETPKQDITITFMKFPKTTDQPYATVVIKEGSCIGDKMPEDPSAEHLIFKGWSATEDPLEVIPDVATVGWDVSTTLYGVWEDDIPSYGTYVLHAEADNNWKADGTNQIYLYAYNAASGKSNAAWPGQGMNFEGYDESTDKDFYSVVVSEFFDTAIFVAVNKDSSEAVRQTSNVSISKLTCESKCAVLGNIADGEGHYNIELWFNVFSIKFYNGSELLKDSYGYDGHKVLSFPENPSQEGKEFKGWSTDGTEANIVDFLTYVVTGNLTVKAVFGEPSPVKIYFEAKPWWETDSPTTYIYIFNSKEDKKTPFPGDAMTYECISGDNRIYSYTIPVGYKYFIISRCPSGSTDSWNETPTMVLAERGSNNAVWADGNDEKVCNAGWFTYEVK